MALSRLDSPAALSSIYGLNMPVTANWDTSAQVPYDVDNSAAAGAFTRVAYRMVLGAETVWGEMDAFTTDKTKLGIPTDWIFDQDVRGERRDVRHEGGQSVQAPSPELGRRPSR